MSGALSPLLRTHSLHPCSARALLSNLQPSLHVFFLHFKGSVPCEGQAACQVRTIASMPLGFTDASVLQPGMAPLCAACHLPFAAAYDVMVGQPNCLCRLIVALIRQSRSLVDALAGSFPQGGGKFVSTLQLPNFSACTYMESLFHGPMCVLMHPWPMWPFPRSHCTSNTLGRAPWRHIGRRHWMGGSKNVRSQLV